MTSQEKVKLAELGKRVSEEQDPVEFQRLVVELPDLLEQAAPGKKNDSKPD
jgi:hypothetical protein